MDTRSQIRFDRRTLAYLTACLIILLPTLLSVEGSASANGLVATSPNIGPSGAQDADQDLTAFESLLVAETPTFLDVPMDHWAFNYIEVLYQHGYIAGCSDSPLRYCPEASMTRAESAVFVERGIHGAGYLPQDPSAAVFEDVPLMEWFAKWANGLWEDGYTAGCGATPLIFCPLQEHTRAEAAVFFERMLHGKDYVPPDPSGQVYEDVPAGPGAPWFSKWVSAAYEDGILQECEDLGNRGDGRFRPMDGLSRAEAACMMVKAKSLPIPPPPSPIDGEGIWISPEELATLPTNGPAWEQVKSIADSDFGQAQGGHNDKHDTSTLAQALVAARLGLKGEGAPYRAKAADNIMSAIGTENNGNALSLGRNLPSYVIAADLIDFPRYDAARERDFRIWISDVRYTSLDGRWIIEASENRPNNWGLMTLAARIAVASYLDKYGVPASACQGLPAECRDPGYEIQRVAQIFKGWLGDRSSYDGFKYGSLAWQSDPAHPVGINPKGATIDGHNVDGVLPDDQRRAGGFQWPPPKENYVYEAMQAVIVTAVHLHRHGYDVWNWEDQAILRAWQWLHTPHFKGASSYPAEGDDTWQPHVINYYYGTDFPAPTPSNPGKNMGWTDWTHNR